MVNEGKLSVGQAIELYPEMNFTNDKGKTHTERANKYFIMLGEDGDTKGVSLAERRCVPVPRQDLLHLESFITMATRTSVSCTCMFKTKVVTVWVMSLE